MLAVKAVLLSYSPPEHTSTTCWVPPPICTIICLGKLKHINTSARTNIWTTLYENNMNHELQIFTFLTDLWFYRLKLWICQIKKCFLSIDWGRFSVCVCKSQAAHICRINAGGLKHDVLGCRDLWYGSWPIVALAFKTLLWLLRHCERLAHFFVFLSYLSVLEQFECPCKAVQTMEHTPLLLKSAGLQDQISDC